MTAITANPRGNAAGYLLGVNFNVQNSLFLGAEREQFFAFCVPVRTTGSSVYFYGKPSRYSRVKYHR